MTLNDVSIFERKRKAEGRNPSWHAQVRNPLTGKFDGGKAYSVRKLAKDLGMKMPPKMNKKDATIVVQAAIDRGLVVQQYSAFSANSFSPLGDFVMSILDYQSSPWVAHEKKRTGDGPSKKYVDNLSRAMRLYGIPNIGSMKTIGSFTRADAKALVDKLSSHGISPDNINSVVKGLRTAYNFAAEAGICDYNPVDRLKQFKAPGKKVEILTPSELRDAIMVLERYACISPTQKAAWLATRLAVHSGMREGEIRAFSLDQMQQVVDDNGVVQPYYRIEVNCSWDDAKKEKGKTKGRYDRTTVIPENLAEDLIAFAEENDRQDSPLLFKSFVEDVDVPIVKNVFQMALYKALAEIGINEAERRRRGITFHSLRHYFDTVMKDLAERQEHFNKLIREAVGHKSRKVDESIYTHTTARKLIFLGGLSEHLLDDMNMNCFD